MSRNIKEIGKELMGKSLNSFHRKTGLTQLEKNNEMQDGILDGILSQVDDAYIEKTEQSNVIHLDGSGDGVVALDSIEGNTMVNILPKFSASSIYYNGKNYEVDNEGYATISGIGQWVKPFFTNTIKNSLIKHDTIYTIICDVKENTLTRTNTTKNTVFDICSNGVSESLIGNVNGEYSYQIGETGRKIVTVQTKKESEVTLNADAMYFPRSQVYNVVDNGYIKYRLICLEGDWTNREIPSYFEGLQSSFEEKVNDEGKYEIEILMKNKNLFDGKYKLAHLQGGTDTVYKEGLEGTRCAIVKVPKNKRVFVLKENSVRNTMALFKTYPVVDTPYKGIVLNDTGTFVDTEDNNYLAVYVSNESEEPKLLVEVTDKQEIFKEHKSNKIKLLINEPLRKAHNKNDILQVKDGRLMVKRSNGEIIVDKTSNNNVTIFENVVRFDIGITNSVDMRAISDNLPLIDGYTLDKEHFYIFNNRVYMFINKSKLTSLDRKGLDAWLKDNPLKIIYTLSEPYYEEVTNEYGEPILLEGYENGTVYIDSTIVPTTTVRYTPKMESFKTLNEVSDNNTMLANDINDNIIPYMMDVDFMIMEKEMALMSHKNIRKMEALDMTSMQKRTQDMLERLIKGKTLTEQECKTRITTYLNAGKITDAQAEELMLLIDEVYA